MTSVYRMIGYKRLAEITGEDRGLFRAWKDRGHITPVREDIPYFDWDTIRPIVCNRLGVPGNKWSGESPIES